HFMSFFFQAEDGTRVFHVTEVQTCALPIYGVSGESIAASARRIASAGFNVGPALGSAVVGGADEVSTGSWSSVLGASSPHPEIPAATTSATPPAASHLFTRPRMAASSTDGTKPPVVFDH